jgi:ferrous iron transport protein B
MDAPARTITVALAGNPNCGKTSLFNHLTGSRQKVGNFPGVTVARKEGLFRRHGIEFRVIDLPGVYSLSSSGAEERVARDFLLSERPDIVLNVIDAGNLERNLFLGTQLIEMGLPCLYCLNMADEARKKGLKIDLDAFAVLLHGPAVETVGRTGEGVEALIDALAAMVDQPAQSIAIPYDAHLEAAIERIQGMLKDVSGHPAGDRWLALKLLEGDEELSGRLAPDSALAAAVRTERETLAEQHGEAPEILFADARYGFIQGLLREILPAPPPIGRREITRMVDGILLHRLLGLPIFLFFMWLTFQATFTLGAFPTDWIDQGFGLLAESLKTQLPEGPLRELLAEGVVGGIGAVVVFLPNIVLLFLFLSFFEDSGYMARVAFLMDRFMHVIGLHGKAFIPLLLGFGCNVPAIMATRTMEQPRDRLVTILINPFISCSARLPVFVLFSGAFFPEHAALALLGIHLLGILIAMSAALLLKRTLLAGPSEPFVMELPPYRLPTFRSVLIHMWEKALGFLRKVGNVIIAGSIVIWFLQAYPRHDATEVQATPLAGSYLERIGRGVAPAFEPLGIDWRGAVALLSGFVAKEVVISTLAVIHQTGEESEDDPARLRKALSASMTPQAAAAFMAFTLLYTPCLATIGVIRRETGSRNWTVFSVLFSLCTAWLCSFLVFHLGVLFI